MRRLRELELAARERQVIKYEELLEWLRKQLLMRDPQKLGDLAAKIDDVLALSREQQQTQQGS